MRVEHDKTRCEGHGVCAGLAPALFRLDEDGELILTYKDNDIPSTYEQDATVAVNSCPVEALRAH